MVPPKWITAKTAKYGCWKSTFLPWNTVTLLKSQSMVCCLSTEINWPHFLQWNDNSWTLPRTEIEFHFYFWELMNKTAGFSRMGLRLTQKIQRCRCWASSSVVAFLKTCVHLDPRIYRHRISVFGGFWRRTCTKTTRAHHKNWNKILSYLLQTSLQKLFTWLHQTLEKE
jgi:hypothetical protein